MVLSPEEWVRQHLVHYLVELGYPASLMSVERSLPQSSRRYDLVIYSHQGSPILIAECKAPSVEIDNKTLDQLNAYLQKLPVKYSLLTNGFSHFFLERMPNEIKSYKQIPQFTTLSQ